MHKYIKIPNFITAEECARVRGIFEAHKDNPANTILTSVPEYRNPTNLAKTDIPMLWSLIYTGYSHEPIDRDFITDIGIKIKESFNFDYNTIYHKNDRGMPFLLQNQPGFGLRAHLDPRHSNICPDAIYDLPTGWELMRGNILISKPEGGGEFYLKKDDASGQRKYKVSFEEGDLVLFTASSTLHEVTPVEGIQPRLMFVTSIGINGELIDGIEYRGKENFEYITI